jgi:hypothetical protein
MPSKFLCFVSIPPNTLEQIAEVLPNFAPLQGVLAKAKKGD